MVVGEDISVLADDDARSEAGVLLRLVVFEFIAEEEAESWIVHEGMCRLLHFTGGEDVHHGRHHFLRGATETGAGQAGGVFFRFALVQCHDAAASGGGEQAWFEGVYDEQNCQPDGGGLREQEPEFTHVMIQSGR